MRRTTTIVLALLLAALGLGACDVQTATAPTGDLTLYANFDDVQDLTRGHYVQMSDVVVGSVSELSLDGRRARARLDISSDREVPVGTLALVRRTSLLGEHFVDLVLPADYEPGQTPLLEDGADIPDTASQLELEELASRAGAVVGAIGPAALSSTFDAADRAFGGRGPQVNELLAKTGDVVATLGDQQDQLVGVVDSVAAIGAQFAPRADDLAALLDSLDDATATVAGSRDRAVTAAEALIELARTTTDVVIAPHTERIVNLIDQADPVIGVVAAQADSISGLFDDIVFFNGRLPAVIGNGQVLVQAWLDPFILLGSPETIDVTDPADLIAALLNGTL